eukprot:g461.t1
MSSGKPCASRDARGRFTSAAGDLAGADVSATGDLAGLAAGLATSQLSIPVVPSPAPERDLAGLAAELAAARLGIPEVLPPAPAERAPALGRKPALAAPAPPADFTAQLQAATMASAPSPARASKDLWRRQWRQPSNVIPRGMLRLLGQTLAVLVVFAFVTLVAGHGALYAAYYAVEQRVVHAISCGVDFSATGPRGNVRGGLVEWLFPRPTALPQLLSSRAANGSFTIAFLGDLSTVGGALGAVLGGLHDGAGDGSAAAATTTAQQLVLLGGDIDYANDFDKLAALLDAHASAHAGGGVGVLATMGNHDTMWVRLQPKWQRLMRVLQPRLPHWMECSAHMGVRSVCTVPAQGIVVVQAAPGLCGSQRANAEFVRRALLRHRDWPIKIVSFHHPQHAMQTGDKADDAGWDIYEVSRRAGALVVNAHNHGYSRTKLLSNFASQAIAADQRTLKPGQSAAIVSGLGGGQIHVVHGARVGSDRHWAATYSDSPGALLCSVRHTPAPATPAALDCKFVATREGAPPRVVDTFSYNFASA